MKTRITRKRRKSDDSSDGTDRFSNLSDDLVLHIFSFLETIDVIRFCLASRQRRYMWTSIPYLNLDVNNPLWSDSDSESESPLSLPRLNERFQDFVNWVLGSHQDRQKIERLRLCCGICEDNRVNDWIIRAGPFLRLKEVHLTMNVMPLALFPAASYEPVAVLKLDMCFGALPLPAPPGFRFLKSLQLVRVKFTDEIRCRDFFASCSLVEDLSIRQCSFLRFDVLEISAMNLKNLGLCQNHFAMVNLRARFNLSKTGLQIVCPSLESFSFVGDAPYNVIVHKSSSSLQFASLIFLDGRHMSQLVRGLHETIQGLCNTKVLKLSATFLRNLEPEPLAVISFHNLKTLNIGIEITEFFHMQITNLLRCSPNLEVLKIFIEQYILDYKWKLQSEGITCLRNHLKVVELVDFCGNESLLQLVKFLLKNGKVLEKMNIVWNQYAENMKETMLEIKEFATSSSSPVALEFIKSESDIDIYQAMNVSCEET